MYKRLGLLGILLALVLLTAVPTAHARGGPPQTVIGSVWIEPGDPEGLEGYRGHMRFRAREAPGDDSVSGVLYWHQTWDGGELTHRVSVDTLTVYDDSSAFLGGLDYANEFPGGGLRYLSVFLYDDALGRRVTACFGLQCQSYDVVGGNFVIFD